MSGVIGNTGGVTSLSTVGKMSSLTDTEIDSGHVMFSVVTLQELRRNNTYFSCVFCSFWSSLGIKMALLQLWIGWK